MPNRQDQRGRSKGGAPFVQLYVWMVQSPAWLALKPSSVSVYIQLHSRFNGSNNGRLAFSARDAATVCNINKDTASKAFQQLVDLGFIECVTPGGFSRKVRHATEWRLTHLLCDKTRQAGTRAFMKWRPELQNPVPKKVRDGPKTRPEGVPVCRAA